MRKGPCGPSFTFRNKASFASEPGNANVSRAPASGGNAREGAVGQIKDAATVVRAVVRNFDHHAFPIVLIGHSHPSAEGKIAMGSSEAVSIEALATGRTPSIEAVANSIPRGSSALNRSLGFLRAEGNEQ